MLRGWLGLLLLLGACGNRGALSNATDAATDASAVVPGSDAREAALPADAGAGAADASQDLAAAPVERADAGWAGYVKAMDERFDQWSTRVAECFNSSKELLGAQRE